MIIRGDVRERIETAVRRAAQMGTVPGGIDHQSGAGSVANSTPPADVTTTVSGGGSTVPPMLWGEDNWNAATWTESI